MGSAADFTEYDPKGALIFDGRFVDGNASYRAYRLPWSAQPAGTPAVAASTAKRTTTVYASWNGATNVADWRVLGGGAVNALRAVSTARKRGFETAITLAAQTYVAVQALDSAGRTLSQSPTIRAVTRP